MPEPQAEPNGPQQRKANGGEPEPFQPLPGPAEAQAGAAGGSLVGPGAEPSDDTPTVISRLPPPQGRTEDGFAGSLRGRKLAHFELLEPVGVGGMAAVIRARDLQLDRTVALKILPPEMAADPENIRRFHQEARAAARLDHENIARVFFCNEDQGLHFIAFEFVEGDNLRTRLERRGRLAVTEAVHYMLQVATGLAHAAARGVVHRDIKPSNIIISPNGRAKLVDMGLARSIEPHGDKALTQSGVTLGTFDYISPEQALEPRDADARSDIYSLGCTFYHMLTGKPPVPDGTAAKKLHHHQHVAPVDPRQLNPEIPDEVAVILGRMMAKDPKDRYQRPEHLVQHLIGVAQKLGAAEAGEGVLFVDAPLPAPPQSRPVLVAVAGTLCLIAVVALLGPVSWSPGPATKDQGLLPRRTAPPEGDHPRPAGEAKKTTAEPPGPGAAPPRPPADATRPVQQEVGTAKELHDFLAQDHPQAVALLTRDLDLTREAQETGLDPGLVLEGPERQVTIEPKEPTGHRTVRLTYHPNLGKGDPWAALTIKGLTVVLRRLRFEVDAALSADVVMTAVALEKAGQLTLDECEFIQAQTPATQVQGRLSSVAVEGPRGDGLKPTLTLTRCDFRRGQHAVTLAGPVRAAATDCSFGPHAALLHLRGAGPAPAIELSLKHCSAFVVNGPAFRLDEGTSCQLDVRFCIFSCPGEGPRADGPRAVLVWQAGDDPDPFRYVGQRNYYHRLEAFLARPAGKGLPVTSWEAFKREEGITDEASLERATSPWKEERPLQKLEEDGPRLAFHIDVRAAELRLPPDDKGLVGVERCTWGTPYPGDSLPPLDKKAEVVARKKIVDPDVRESGHGVYPSLSQAIGEAKPGDVIQIRHTGLLPVEPVQLERAGLDLTIEPHPNHHPVLTLGPTSNPDAALFRVHDGQLNLVDLEFRLQPPRRSQFTNQAVVAVVGDGECTFERCVVTLKEVPGVNLAVVTLFDPSTFRRMDPRPARSQPSIRLDSCFVRGVGGLVMVRASRPLELAVENSLVALDGTFLTVDGHRDEVPATPVAQVKLAKVTAYLTEHLVLLRAGPNSRGLVPTRIGDRRLPTVDCLFAAAEGKSLVHLDGLNNDMMQMRRLFSWEGRHNAYSGFTQVLDQQPKGDDMAPAPYDQSRWLSFAHEREQVFLPTKVKFEVPPAAEEAALARVLPVHFKLRADTDPALQTIGADLDRLPKPTGEE
jgi:hypothetical protein